MVRFSGEIRAADGPAFGGQDFAFVGRGEAMAMPQVSSVERAPSGRFRVQFSAPFNPLTVDSDSIQLVGNDGGIIPCSFAFGETDTVVELLPLVPVPSEGASVRLSGAVEGHDGRRSTGRTYPIK